jgi:hypothetical protein
LIGLSGAVANHYTTLIPNVEASTFSTFVPGHFQDHMSPTSNRRKAGLLNYEP